MQASFLKQDCHADCDSMYTIDGYSLFRNDSTSTTNVRPFGGTAVYSRIDYYPAYPYCNNINDIEMTIMRFMALPHVTIIGLYRSPGIPVTQLYAALRAIFTLLSTQHNIFIGDFNVNWFNESQRTTLYNLFVRDNNYRQLVSSYTTDNKTCIDHIYTNLPKSQVNTLILETYFSDHKSACALINCFQNDE